MAGMTPSRRTSRSILSRNLIELQRHIIDPCTNKPITRREIARRAGRARETINALFRDEGPMPTLATLDALADALEVEPWMLLLPELPDFLSSGGELSHLIRAYAHANDSGRHLIDQVAEHAAGYSTTTEN